MPTFHEPSLSDGEHTQELDVLDMRRQALSWYPRKCSITEDDGTVRYCRSVRFKAGRITDSGELGELNLEGVLGGLVADAAAVDRVCTGGVVGDEGSNTIRCGIDGSDFDQPSPGVTT